MERTLTRFSTSVASDGVAYCDFDAFLAHRPMDWFLGTRVWDCIVDSTLVCLTLYAGSLFIYTAPANRAGGCCHDLL